MHLTFYMFNEKTKMFEQALNPEKFAGQGAYEELDFKITPPFEARAFLQKNRRNVPDWLSYVKNYLEIDERGLLNTSNSLVILVKESGRIFATTMGYGYSAINRSNLEKRFGLKVVLNAINPENIRMIDSRQLDINTKQKREFLSRNSPLHEFDFDVDADILRLISGEPTDEKLAKKLTGSDSLKLSADVEFEEIGQKCKELFQEFKKDTYKKNFPFIDSLNPVSDPELIESLDQLLLTAFNNREDTSLILAYPDMIDFEKTVSFKVSMGLSYTSRIQEIELPAIYGFLNGLNPVESLSDISIIGIDDGGSRTTKKYRLYEFCVFEVEYSDRRFLLSLEQWFEIDENYIAEVDNALTGLEEIEPGFLPNMLSGQSEGTYNKAVGEKYDYFVSLDKNNYRPSGYSQIEVCDILSKNAEFICVKKYNSSSTLSHLFAQGYVSSELLLEFNDYRKFVLDECPEFAASLPITVDAIDARDSITFVFAIAFKKDKPLVEMLPFFSKVNLRNIYRQIERLGFRVKTYRIPWEQNQE